MALDLHPIGSSCAPSLCVCTGRNASGQVALPWVVAKRAPRRHRLRTPAFLRERGAECRQRIPIELYPEVVDAGEEEGGVPSRLIKTDRREAEKEGTPCMMFARSGSGSTT